MKIHYIILSFAVVLLFGISDGFCVRYHGTRIATLDTMRATQNGSVLRTSRHRWVVRHVEENDDNANNIPANNDYDQDSSEDRPATTRRRLTTARAGGRGSKNYRRPSNAVTDATDLKPSTFPGWILAPSLLVCLFLWGLFGGDGVDSNFYYYSYSTTVFETQTYNPNSGQIETQRKESGDFQSNIPGLRISSSSNNNEIIRPNQRRLEGQDEKEYLDSLNSETLRAVEDLLDNSWE